MRCGDKVALVTGGSSGIGRSICIELAKEGAAVAVNYVEGCQAEAVEVVETIRRSGGRAEAIQADVSRKAEVDAMIKWVDSTFGKIDVLVNNAGICPFAEVLDITEELWDRTLNINLKGTFLCAQAAAKAMVGKSIRGSIITISSINHYAGGKLQAHYGAAKSGQANLMKSFALGLAPHGIRCNSIMPGTIATNINKDFLAVKENYDYLTARIPLGRIGEPVDIAKAAVYFASEESSYCSGSELLIDGASLINYL